MKKIIVFLLAIAMLVASPVSAIATEIQNAKKSSVFAGGDGSESNPYQVSNAKQLDAVRKDLSAHYIQVADIDLSGMEWKPIGATDTAGEGAGFTGFYDGNGYVISNLTITSIEPGNRYVGLFGYCGPDSGGAGNITLTGMRIDIRHSDGQLSADEKNGLYVGGVVGYGDTGFCSVDGYIQVKYGSVVVGDIDVYDYDDDYVEQAICVGGVTGVGDSYACVNFADIVVESTCEAGRTTASDMHSSPTVFVGGVLGTDGYAWHCVNYGEVRAVGECGCVCGGGISGYPYGKIEDCVNYGHISASSDCLAFAGGLAGTNIMTRVSNSINRGDVESDTILLGGHENGIPFRVNVSGGLVGWMRKYARDSVNFGNISAGSELVDSLSAAGGIAGCTDGQCINTYNLGLEVWADATLCEHVLAPNIKEPAAYVGAYYGCFRDGEYISVDKHPSIEFFTIDSVKVSSSTKNIIGFDGTLLSEQEITEKIKTILPPTDWDVSDEWCFRNYVVKKIPLTDADYRALVNGLSKKDKAQIDKLINRRYNGQCYGMAVTAVLAKRGVLPLNMVALGQENLHDINKTESAQSVIGYYFLSQYTKAVQDEISHFKKIPVGDQLELMEEKSFPFLLVFSCDGWGAHAIVATGLEVGNWNRCGHTYDRRILTYDSNYKGSMLNFEDSYLYFNSTTDEWVIPNYYNYGISSDGKGKILLACDDIDILNIWEYWPDLGDIGMWLRNETGDAFSITTGGNTYKISGESSSVEGKLSVSYDIGYNVSAPEITALNVRMQQLADVTLFPSANAELDISMLSSEWFIDATAASYDAITLNKDGGLSVNGIEGTYAFQIVADEQFGNVWDTVKLTGSATTNLAVQMTTEGVLVTGDDLSDAVFTGTNENGTVELKLNTHENKLLLTGNTTGEVLVWADTDDDGTYESTIVDGVVHEHIYEKWLFDDTQHCQICNCGKSLDAENHVYHEKNSNICSVCGYKRESGQSGLITQVVVIAIGTATVAAIAILMVAKKRKKKD